MKTPKEVVEYLDEHTQVRAMYGMVFTLFTEGAVLDVDDPELSNPVSQWVYAGNLDEKGAIERELAVIEHVFGDKRLEVE